MVLEHYSTEAPQGLCEPIRAICGNCLWVWLHLQNLGSRDSRWMKLALDSDNKPFFFSEIALFFRSRTIFFRTRKTSTFFQITSNFFQIDLFRSSLFYGAYTPSDRSLSVGSTPQPHPKMVFFYACRLGGGIRMGLPKQQQISDVITTISRAINNKFQTS